jgi:signal peptidase I
MKLSNNFKRFLRVFFAICIFLCVSTPKNDFFVIVVGNSMNPALKNGQLVLASKDVSQLYIGDIVVIKQNKENIIKRITATQGAKYAENISAGDDYMLIPDFLGVKMKSTPHAKILFKTIPENFYFVEGDNRGNSFDSKNFGLIHRSQIIGKCLL